jgi:phospholipase/carboxylesterase
MTELSAGPTLRALSCGKPAYLVVLLAGERVTARELIDCATLWAPAMIKADFVSLEAPFADGSWLGADAEQAAEALDGFLDVEFAARRLPAAHVALVGFGEGARLAARIGLARRDCAELDARLAAIVGFSGFYEGLPAPGDGAPLLLVHGEADATAPFAQMADFKASLKAAGAPVWSFRRPGLGHALDAEGVEAAGQFLARHVRQEKGA